MADKGGQEPPGLILAGYKDGLRNMDHERLLRPHTLVGAFPENPGTKAKAVTPRAKSSSVLIIFHDLWQEANEQGELTQLGDRRARHLEALPGAPLESSFATQGFLLLDPRWM
jgi:hypothetical protein